MLVNEKLRNWETLPNFLGIGAQKAGTGWLFINLKRHPEIFLPPRKEIHYFDRSLAYPSPSFLASDRFFTRLFGKGSHNKDSRVLFLRSILANMCHPKWTDILWNYKFLLGRYDDHWYASLFKKGRDKIRGEITPSYSILDPGDVEKIRKIMPDVRIIYILRNPIYRAWSQIRFDMQSTLRSKSLTQLKEFVESPAQSLRGNYIRTINIWRNYIPEEQFFIGFYDEIEHDPRKFLEKIFTFIGVKDTTSSLTENTVFHRVNESPQARMPTALKLYLTKKYYNQIKKLSSMFGSYATSWINEAESTLHTVGQGAASE